MKKSIFLGLILLASLGVWASGSLQAERFIPKSDLIPAVLSTVNRSYVDASRLKPEVMLAGSLERLSISVVPVMTRLNQKSGKLKVTVSVDQFSKEFIFAKPKTSLALNKILQKVSHFTKEHLEPGENLEDVDYALINGFLKKLDPHTMLLVPDVYSDFNQSTTGNYGGVGMMIGLREGQLTIISPIDDTPASKAGLHPKDRIMQIGDESTINISLSEAVAKLKGKPGTQVTVYILRDGFSKPRPFVLTRAVITINSVESHRFEDKGKTVGYIKLKTFGKSSLDEMNEALSELDADLTSFQGLILDLRNNPGGLLQQAIAISDRFLDKGVIVSTAGLDPKSIRSMHASWPSSLLDFPIIILVNNGSASASEIVTAALKAHGRAVVMGRRTFGKGSVQQIIPMAGGSGLKITMSKYLTPGNHSIQSVGVAPHIEVYPVQVTPKFLRLTPAKEDIGENELEQNFAEWGDRAENPDLSTFYLVEDTKEAKKAEDLSPKELAELQRKKDHLLQSAIQILFQNQRRGYKNPYDFKGGQKRLLKSSFSYFQKEEAEQTLKVEKRFAELGINWKPYPSRSGSRILSRAWFELKGKDGKYRKHRGPIPADADLKLYLEAKNIGKKTLDRLIAVSKSENNALDDRQFAFGRLAPGQARKWYIPLQITSGGFSRSDIIRFEFQDGKKRSLHRDQIELAIVEKARPSFVYEIKQKAKRIEAGDKVTLELTVKNQGQGQSGKLTLLLKNGEGNHIFLKQGRQSLKPLKPGEEAKARFLFELHEKPLDGNLDLSLDIIDGTFPLAGINQKLKLPLSRLDLKNDAPQITLSQVANQSKSRKLHLSGTVFDQGGVKDLFVLLNNKKIYYKNYLKQNQRGEVKLSLDLELEDKVNRIIIVSRDDQNVDAKKAIYVRYLGAK